jgi:hypothetical protein
MWRIYPLISLLLALSAHVSAQSETGIREVNFENRTFPFTADTIAALPRSIHVSEGRYRSPHREPSLTYAYFKVAEVVYGDLNGDDRDEAAVVAIYGGASSDTYKTSVYLYSMNGRRPKLLAILNEKAIAREYGRTSRNGESSFFEAVAGGTTIEQRRLTVRHFAGSAHCCPRNVFTLRYRLNEGRLALVGKSLRRKEEAEERIPHSAEDR